MRKMSKVSIIIPAYNEALVLPTLLESIKNQTYKNIETIVIDDASTDSTARVAKPFTPYVFTRKHAERSVQRNFGAEKAKGEYLLFLDADMELSAKVVESCVDVMQKSKHKALIVPEKTVGNNFIAKIRNFEREMYEGDATIEVARFFETKVFNEFKGYDIHLTGAEDYDLPRRISSKYSIGWAKEYIYHHEENLTLMRLLKKKYYYAGESALYADKYPDLVAKQGTILFRSAYVKNWKKFLLHPFLGIAFLGVRILETTWAVCGYINAVGIVKFSKTLFKMFQVIIRPKKYI